MNQSSSGYTNDAASPSEVTIGENITIHLKANMPEGNTSDLIISDQLAANLSYQSSRVITVAADSYGTLNNDFNGSITSSNCPNCVLNSVAPNLNFNFTGVNVATDANGLNNYFVVEVVAKVIDLPINHGNGTAAAATFSNLATIQANGRTTNSSGTLNFKIVEPRIIVNKTLAAADASASAHPNSTITSTIVFTNTGLTAAHEVVWTDTLPTTLIYNTDSGNLNCSPAILPSPNFTYNSEDTVSGSIGVLPVGTTCTINFTATLNSSINVNDTPNFTNGIDIHYSSHPNTYSGERPYTSNAVSNIFTVLVPDLVIDKDDLRNSVIPNQQYIYSLTVSNNGQATASGVIITDNIPLNTTMLPDLSSGGWLCPSGFTAGNICSINLGTITNGSNTSVNMALQVDFSPSVTNIVNTAYVNDDGSHGIDPTPENNIDTDTDIVAAAVDLGLSKHTESDSATYNDEQTFTLEYINTGTSTASSVVITEVVPAHSSFVPASSSVGWSCTPDNNPGSNCQINIGNVSSGATDNIFFTVKTDDYPPYYTEISNTASIADDGSHGPEITYTNNTATATLPIQYSNVFDPPSAYKSVNDVGESVVNWKMVWINDGNALSLLTQVIDPIPTGTTYKADSFTCDARGSSSTTQCYYDSVNNRVFWEGFIAPDPGGSTEDNSLHEVVLEFQTTVAADINDLSNQAVGYWDDNGNGNIIDEQGAGQAPVLTNDPRTNPQGDATLWHRPLSRTGLNLIIFSSFGIFLIVFAGFTVLYTRKRNETVVFRRKISFRQL